MPSLSQGAAGSQATCACRSACRLRRQKASQLAADAVLDLALEKAGGQRQMGDELDPSYLPLPQCRSPPCPGRESRRRKCGPATVGGDCSPGFGARRGRPRSSLFSRRAASSWPSEWGMSNESFGMLCVSREIGGDAFRRLVAIDVEPLLLELDPLALVGRPCWPPARSPRRPTPPWDGNAADSPAPGCGCTRPSAPAPRCSRVRRARCPGADGRRFGIALLVDRQATRRPSCRPSWPPRPSSCSSVSWVL